MAEIIIGTTEPDTIRNTLNSSAINALDGGDLIINGGYWENERGGSKVSLSGGVGNDTLTSHGSNSVLDGGDDADLIYNGYRYYEPWNAFYDSDDENYNGNGSTILGGAGNDSIKNRGHIVLIGTGTGNDSVDNYGDSITVDGGEGDDLIINGGYWENERGGSKVSLSGGAGNDTLTSHGSNSVLDGGDDADVIYNGYRYYEPWNAFYDSDDENYNGNGSTILGGAGNDSISNKGSNVTINTGTGNDSIVNYGENVLVLIEGGHNTINGNVTVNMGTGNTTLTGDRSAQVFQYVSGDDVITNYSHEDTIEIAQGEIDSYFLDGGDLVFKVGDGSITLKNMTNHAITVKDSSGKTTTQIYGTGYSGQQVIKNFVQSTTRTALPDGGLKIDEAIKACSHFNSLEEVVNQMVADCRTAGDADTFLRNYCGIILDNDDSGSPTGWDAGGLAAKTMKDLIPEIGDATYPESTTFIKHGVTVTVPEKDSLTEKEQLVVRGFYSWWAEGAFKLIEETYGVSLNGYSVELKFSNEPDKGYWGTGGTVVTVNMAYTQGITKTNNVGVDGLFAHELTHFMQAVFGHLGYIYSMYPYMIEGMANLTGGSGGTFASAGDPEQLAKDLALIDNNGNDCYDVGYMFWRYLMKQASDSYDSLKSYAWKDGSTIEGTSAAEFLTGSGSNMILTAGAGNDTITAYGKKTKVFGNEGDDYILTGANAEELTLDGGDGADYITNNSSNTLIDGGAGNDSISNKGSNTSTNGGAGNDSVDNYGNSITVDGGEGDDLIINGGYWENERGGSKVSLSGGSGNDTLTSHGSNSILNGGAGDDLIYNGYRYYEPWNAFYDSDDEDYNGNGSTILGGEGNDNIKNRGENVLFKHADSDGFDIIEGFNDTSTLQIGNGKDTYSAINDNGNVIVTVGEGNITLKSAAGGIVNIAGTDKSIPTWALDGTKATCYTWNKTLATVSGVKSASGLKLSGSAVTVSKAALNAKKVTVSNGYKLKLGKDVTKTSTKKAWILNKNTAAYKQTTKAGYALSGNVINYTKAATKTLATVSGVKSTKGISVSGKVVKLKKSSLAAKVTVNGSGYEFDLTTGNYKKTLVTGSQNADIITSHGKNLLISGGKGNDSIKIFGSATTVTGGKGNDSLWGNVSADKFIYEAGDGNDVIFGFDNKDTLTFGNIEFTTAYSKKNQTVTFKAGSGSVVLKAFTATAFHVNDDVYKISGSKFKKQ